MINTPFLIMASSPAEKASVLRRLVYYLTIVVCITAISALFLGGMLVLTLPP